MTLFSDIKFHFVIMLAVNLVFLLFVDSLNDILSPNAYLFVPAIYILAPSLFLSRTAAVLMGIMMGFFCSTAIDARVGALAFLFGGAALLVNILKQRFKGLESFGVIWLGWILNTSLFIIVAIFVFPKGVAPYSSYIFRVLVDAVASSFFIILFVAFSVNLQRSVFYLFGENISLEGKR